MIGLLARQRSVELSQARHNIEFRATLEPINMLKQLRSAVSLLCAREFFVGCVEVAKTSGASAQASRSTIHTVHCNRQLIRDRRRTSKTACLTAPYDQGAMKVGNLVVALHFALAVFLTSCTTAADEAADSKSDGKANETDVGSSKSTFADPAPPKLLKVADTPAPKPKPYDRVTFHKNPKPLPKGAVTHNWTTFLGPTHNAISTETKLLKKWPKSGPSLVWELAKGAARDISYSSPSIQDDYLVFPHRVADQVFVECLHPETGELYWQFKFDTDYRDRYGYGNGPRASPVISDGRVYIYGARGDLYCLKLETGQLYWKRELSKEFDVQQGFFGVVATPLVQNDLLIIIVGAPDGPCVIGINKFDGKVVWGSSNSSGSKWGASYASPIPASIHGKRRVFVFAGGDSQPPTGGLLCLDPANGNVDFEFPWRSRSYESVNASCPVVINNQVFISATYKAGSTLLKINPDFSPATVWKMSDREHNTREDQLGLHWNTAVYKEGHLYAFDGRNEPDASLVCVNAKTGKVVWRETPEWREVITVNDQTQDFTLSTLRGCLLSVDGDFLCLGEYGHLLWLDLTPEGYRELARAKLFLAQQSWALPVVSRGLLYISQNQPHMLKKNNPRLLCYDLRGQ